MNKILVALIVFCNSYTTSGQDKSIKFTTPYVSADSIYPDPDFPESSRIDSQVIFDQCFGILPTYKGGIKSMQKFIESNFKYPDSLKKTGIDGRVVLSFIIDTLGKVTDIKIVKSSREDLDNEAIRVCSIMPDWIPGGYPPHKIPIKMILPIQFELKRKIKNCP